MERETKITQEREDWRARDKWEIKSWQAEGDKPGEKENTHTHTNMPGS